MVEPDSGRGNHGKGEAFKAFRRMMGIVIALLARPRSREELAAMGEGDSRDPSSVTRDINVLRNLGWDIPKRGPYTLDSRDVPLLVSPDEAAALVSAAKIARRAGMPGESVLQRLVERVPEEILDCVQAGADVHIQQAVANYQEHEDKLALIRRALGQGRQLRIVYHPPWHANPYEERLDAARLIWIEGSQILFAWCPDRGPATREFRIDRIQHVEVTRQVWTLACPPFFEYMYRTLPGLALSYDPPIDHRAIEERPDGSIVYRARTTSALRAQRHVLAFGDLAEALEPADWRENVARTTEKMALLYPALESGPHTAG